MPNWCNNKLTLSHRDPAMLERATLAFANERLLDEFIPIPTGLKEAGLDLDFVHSHSIDEVQAAINELYEKNVAEYGAINWERWAVIHWGTKWDVGGEAIITGENTIELEFVTAWSPPIEAYSTLVDMGFEVTGYYYEPGNRFCGLFENGSSVEYNLDEDGIPQELIDMFEIDTEEYEN